MEFFFSSRRRHTRFDCDWSSDVCSSDLEVIELAGPPQVRHARTPKPRIGRRVAPALHQLGGGPILRGVPPRDEDCGDLRTAHLIFFPELPAARRPEPG